ncbi:MAG: rane protein insertase, YidC/Oxa1 family, partial [Clostridia bacterium]|nr:rane protein insertase, YidC/Oxa1 family [Clostridia bacterium]
MENIFDFINIIYIPLAMLLKLCYIIVQNYGIAIILFAILTKALLLPLAINGEKSRRNMVKFQPKMAALQSKYKGNTKDPKYTEEL